jgi:hypothetical protein
MQRFRFPNLRRMFTNNDQPSILTKVLFFFFYVSPVLNFDSANCVHLNVICFILKKESFFLVLFVF